MTSLRKFSICTSLLAFAVWGLPGCSYRDLPILEEERPEPPLPLMGEVDEEPGIDLSRVIGLGEHSLPPGDLTPRECSPRWDIQEDLTLNELLTEVYRVSPTLEAARESWHAAAHLYPQVISLDDPQFRLLTGMQLDVARRGSLDDFRQRYQVQQFIPFFGKRRLRGEIASSEAQAVGHGIANARLLLTEATKAAFFEYLIVHWKMDLDEQDRALMQNYLQVLTQQVENGETDEHVLRQAELDQVHLAHRQEQLARIERMTRARLNTLLQRTPDCPLPPPSHLAVLNDLPDPHYLRHTALERRPDVAAQTAKIQAAENAVDLAYREIFPDFYAVGRLDAIDRSSGADFVRSQIGFNVNVPIRLARRKSAIYEAQALLRKQRALHQELASEIQYEVQVAYDSVQQSLRMLEMYPSVIETAERKADSLARRVREKPETAKEWIAARRDVIQHQMEACKAYFEYYRRLAELERIVGAPLREASIDYGAVEQEHGAVEHEHELEPSLDAQLPIDAASTEPRPVE